MRRKLSIFWTCLLSLAAGAQAAEPPEFEREIAPILVTHCLDCHQPNKRSGELDLSTLAGLLKGGEQGAAITPGKPAASLLVERIEAGEMPPPDAKEALTLSKAQMELLRAWIAAGAIWPKNRQLGIHERLVDLDKARQFWSFQPVRRPTLPLLWERAGVRVPPSTIR
jgi:mono/diheme cytochrome c family protein